MMFIVGNILGLAALALIFKNIQLVYRQFKYNNRRSGVPLVATFLFYGAVRLAYPQWFAAWDGLVLLAIVLADLGTWLLAIFLCRLWLGTGQYKK